VYVARDRYYEMQSSSVVERPPQLGVIDTRTDQVRTIQPLQGSKPFQIRFLTVTPDNRYVIAVGESRLITVDIRTDEVIGEKVFATPPAGIAISKGVNNATATLYVWLPGENRLFYTGLSGILKSPSPN